MLLVLLLTLAPAVFSPATLSPAALSPDAPAVFAAPNLEAARKTAAEQNKLLILDAMTSWCAPCKQMDRTTWIDEDLVRWLQQNAVCVQLDMDQHESLKSELRIDAFPTIICFKGGREFDRVIGYRNAEQLGTWLQGVATGNTELDRVKTDLAALPRTEQSIAQRWRLTQELIEYRQDDLAGNELTWIWENHPRAVGIGIVFGARSLVERDAKTRSRLLDLRDTLTPTVVKPLVGANDYLLVKQWLQLCRVLGESDIVAHWAEDLCQPQFARQMPTILAEHSHELFEVLIQEERWSIAGRFLVDPLEQLTSMGENLGAYDEPTPKTGAMMPAIPMGTPKPTAPQNRSLPAIPMGTPQGRRTPTDVDDTPAPKVLPLIPMGGMSPARRVPGSSVDPAQASVAREVRRRLTYAFRDKGSHFYGALLASGREAEADGVARILLKYDDTSATRVALIRGAFAADQMQRRAERHAQWLAEAMVE